MGSRCPRQNVNAFDSLLGVRSTVKRKSTIAVVAICLLVGSLWVATRVYSRPEPIYQGKPVSYWARQSRHAVDDDSMRILAKVGAVAVPCLTNQLALKDGALKRSWLWTWAKLPPAMRARLPHSP